MLGLKLIHVDKGDHGGSSFLNENIVVSDENLLHIGNPMGVWDFPPIAHAMFGALD